MVTVKKKPKTKIKLTPQQKEQNAQRKEIIACMKNIGFTLGPKVDGKLFQYEKRDSELDDIFFFENVVLIMEYTIGDPSKHLLDKKHIYDLINVDKIKFIKFLLDQPKFKSLKDTFDTKIFNKYTVNQLQIKILYASKQTISPERKNFVENVCYFDYVIFKYFESISKVIKKSARYEFFDFLEIDDAQIGENILLSSLGATDEFSGHILPEDHSSFKEGYKLITFYIDAESLLKRAYVLRNNGWQKKEHIGFYQRMLSIKKINKMRKYLHDEERVFINNIIATLPIEGVTLFDEKDIQLEIDENGKILGSCQTKAQPAKIKIKNKINIIGLIDGQHRSFAYHEGEDIYENKISKLRKIQNLLITGILFPKNETAENKLKFEAKLFLEINSNQQSVGSGLLQEIESSLNAFSITSIAKYVLNELNNSGPLEGMFELYWFESNKIKTASIINFGLKQLLKFDGSSSLYSLWDDESKEDLRLKKQEYEILKKYEGYCVVEIRNLFIGLSRNIDKENWAVSRRNHTSILNVTTIVGVIKCLGRLIENGKTGDVDYYTRRFSNASSFDFKQYKSSQYSQMGLRLYETFFAD